MKAKKLPSGSYRVRLSVGKDPNTGKYVYKSFTAETAKEAERLAYEWMYATDKVEPVKSALTLEKALEEFNASKKYVLSPTTYVDYECLRKHAFANIAHVPVSELTSNIIQIWINEQSVQVAPKTIRNRYNYLTAFLKVYRPDLKPNVSLPQKKKAAAKRK